MANKTKKALVVTRDEEWSARCSHALRKEGCKVDTAAKGADAFALCQKAAFDLVLLDDSLPDYGPIETVLTVSELAGNRPALLVGGEKLDRFHRFWQRSNVVFAGEKGSVPAQAISTLARLDC